MFRRIIRFFVVLGFLVGLVATAAGLAVGVYYYIRLTRDLPQLERISDYRPKAVSYMYAEDGRLIAELFDEEGLSNWISEQPDMPIWTFDPKPPIPAANAKVTYPDPCILAKLVAGLDKSELEDLASPVLEPEYLSAPFITAPKSR